MKECCKNCTELNYYDGYFCSIGKEMNDNEVEIDYTIDDIDNTRCELFVKRNDSFWDFKGMRF